jgi:SPASM domain peptide maturase of grasp-with-spasm system
LKLNTNLYFILYASYIPVLGHERSVLCNIQTHTLLFITNEMYCILTEHCEKKIIQIIDFYGIEHQETIIEYFNYLLENDVIFLCHENESKLFPRINQMWHLPSIIQNCIVDINNISYFKLFVDQIADLRCPHIQIRVLNHKLDFEKFNLIIDSFSEIYIHTLSLIMPFNAKSAHSLNDQFFYKYPYLNSIIFYNSPKDRNLYYLNNSVTIAFNSSKINPVIDCGIVHLSYFTPNLSHFTESQHHNTCLNRKISIDADGEIKNCPSMAKSYGNIRDTKLIDVVNNPEFQKVWHIKKDEITKCKDCEFRHICTDCRAYLENPEDQYSAPLKCGYNPYTCEWEEWSTNPLKEKAIAFYGMQDLVKKKES